MDGGRRPVVPAEFTRYFEAAAAAAGVLIGLLFVAVSLRPETVLSDGALLRGGHRRARRSLADCVLVSLVALIPQAGHGVVAIPCPSSACWPRTPARTAARQELHIVMLVLSLLRTCFSWSLASFWS